jgi:hypothetical protein
MATQAEPLGVATKLTGDATVVFDKSNRQDFHRDLYQDLYIHVVAFVFGLVWYRC